MDLGAYSQIGELEKIAKANNISVSRLRGYRLMKREAPVEIEDGELDALDEEVCKDWCRSDFGRWGGYEYSRKMNDRIDKFLSEDGDAPKKIRWDKIHGKRRKKLKFAIKNKRKRFIKQFETFSKYAGRDDVLYIHARIGGSNWNYYGGYELEKQPWFLEKVDDYFDSTYCDIYAKIEKV